MAQTLSILNYGTNNLIAGGLTQLSANVAVGASSLPVINSADHSSMYVLVGPPGSNTAELLTNTVPSLGNTIPLSSVTTLLHYQGDPVQALFGNKLNIYRAADTGLGQPPAASAFTLLTTIPIDASGNSTQFTDPNGGSGYWYKFTYYSSATATETDPTAAIAVRGLYSVNYCSLDEIRREAGFSYSPYITNDQIDEKRQAAQDEINGALDEFYQTPLQPPINDWLKDICIRLAAGKLLKAEFSGISDPQVNGQDMYDGAQKDLEKLVQKNRVLVNKQGKPQDGPGGSGSIEGWPNETTAAADRSSGGAPRVFRMSDIQGRGTGTDSAGNAAGNAYYGRKW